MNSRKLFLRATTDRDEIDIARCALIIAGEFQPGLDVQVELEAIDRLATEATAFPVVDAYSLVEFVAIEKSFTGNSDDYYSISNSLLNQVMNRKRGIPITLALVYLSVVQKLKSDYLCLKNSSLNAWGINFPGHFLVGISDSKGKYLIDPFKGELVTKEDCYASIANLYGRHHKPDDRYFEPADSKQLLRRILENLKAINLKNGHATNTLLCLDYQLMLYPESNDLLQQQDKLLEFLRNNDIAGESRLQ